MGADPGEGLFPTRQHTSIASVERPMMGDTNRTKVRRTNVVDTKSFRRESTASSETTSKGQDLARSIFFCVLNA